VLVKCGIQTRTTNYWLSLPPVDNSKNWWPNDESLDAPRAGLRLVRTIVESAPTRPAGHSRDRMIAWGRVKSARPVGRITPRRS
jgi:hypothetical protein